MDALRHLLPSITDVRHVREHVLWVRFADGIAGEIDFAGRMHGTMFSALRDASVFARVGLDHGALVWPNGADWAPEPLYHELCERIRPTKRSHEDARPATGRIVGSMPEISRFFGVVIRMLANDHAPPHFHALYGEFEITVSIRDGLVTGQFPGRALRLVLEWRELHQGELLSNWERLRVGEEPLPIAPLT